MIYLSVNPLIHQHEYSSTYLNIYPSIHPFILYLSITMSEECKSVWHYYYPILWVRHREVKILDQDRPANKGWC